MTNWKGLLLVIWEGVAFVLNLHNLHSGRCEMCGARLCATSTYGEKSLAEIFLRHACIAGRLEVEGGQETGNRRQGTEGRNAFRSNTSRFGRKWNEMQARKTHQTAFRRIHAYSRYGASVRRKR